MVNVLYTDGVQSSIKLINEFALFFFPSLQIKDNYSQICQIKVDHSDCISYATLFLNPSS